MIWRTASRLKILTDIRFAHDALLTPKWGKKASTNAQALEDGKTRSVGSTEGFGVVECD